ncbi:MAG: tRNA (adenosine(37)-N6)-dimethylallyltransferase MiaA, partial [Proteobacteria bacterium]|nr:tRNA (adenosine(37)-N6)-dimethylallyltransferase MiaA [Pseudomonadota bacterium]
DRSELHRRIEARFEDMMAGGLLGEVEKLRSRGDLSIDLPSMRSVGYRQLWQHLEGECDLDEAVRRSIVASRQYAKRQMTWFRAEPDVTWFDSAAAETERRIADAVDAFLRRP